MHPRAYGTARRAIGDVVRADVIQLALAVGRRLGAGPIRVRYLHAPAPAAVRAAKQVVKTACSAAPRIQKVIDVVPHAAVLRLARVGVAGLAGVAPRRDGELVDGGLVQLEPAQALRQPGGALGPGERRAALDAAHGVGVALLLQLAHGLVAREVDVGEGVGDRVVDGLGHPLVPVEVRRRHRQAQRAQAVGRLLAPRLRDARRGDFHEILVAVEVVVERAPPVHPRLPVLVVHHVAKIEGGADSEVGHLALAHSRGVVVE
mmetsp:Transcript_52002/g.135795  ORF Transcript_52002/g.135795 Transcript_52002/m.135795 type:complete len:261 (+) Transcript_52002:2314-3096(+)